MDFYRVNQACGLFPSKGQKSCALGQGDLRLTQEGHGRMVCAKIELNLGNLVQSSKDSP
jgi:hypothetical protein